MNARADSRAPLGRTRLSSATLARAALVSLTLLLAIPLVPGFAASTFHVASPAAAGTTAYAVALSPSAHPAGLPIVNGQYAGTHIPVGAIPSSDFVRPTSLHPASASPARLSGSSTASNFFVNGSDCQGWGPISTSFQFPIGFSGSSVTTVGGSNTTLVAAGGSLIGAYNGTGGNLCNTISISPAFLASGATGVWRSTDGGHTWPSQTFLSINQTHWTNTADASNGSIHWGSPTVASGPSNTVLVGDVYVNGCYFATGCTNATGIQGDWGITVARSTNGGQSFGDPVQLYAAQGLKWFDMGTCAAPYASGFYYYNVPEVPKVAINPSTGLAIMSWDVYHATVSSATCSVMGNAQVLYSTSSDGGVTWSTPKGLSGDLSELSTLTIGPSPGYNITSTFLDFQNATASSISLEMTRSTNNGASWTTPKDVLLAEYYPPGFPPGAGFTFGFGTIPVMAQDSWTGSPYVDHAYLAWSDNGNITSNPGYATIEVSVSSNGGTSFAAPVAPLATSTSTVYVEPSVSVESNGNVWVTYLAINIASGSYNVYGILSTNGGSTWSNQFLLSDSTSTPGASISDIGLFTGGVGTSNGVYPLWLDCSSASCAVSADAQLATANVHAVTISSNITGVSATVTSFGSSRSYGLPATLGWDNASTSTVSVPQFLPDASNTSDVYTFESWSGLSSSTNFQTTVTYSGGAADLVANYQAVPAAILTGTVSPNVPGVTVKVNGIAAPLTPYNATALSYTATVPGGISYPVQASAPNYQTQTHNVQTNQGGTYYWNFTLAKLQGYLVGQLTPATATLQINGTTVTTVNPVTGLFSVAEPFGWYWINASGSGLTSFSAYRQVVAGGNTTVDIVLIGGWVQGVVLGAQPTKPGLVVQLDGQPIAVSSAGTFNNSTLGGFHTLTATQSGYNLSSISLFVQPGRTTLVNVTLTNHGWISGLIQPSTATKVVTLHIYSGSVGNFYPVAANGSFNVSLIGGLNYTVNVSATNYTSYQTHVLVSPGNGTQLAITLQPKQGCTGPNCGNNNPPGGGTTPSSGLTTTDLLLIVVVIVVVAAIAVVLLMRRRGGGAAPEEEAAQPVYEESNPADLPRLQSDGSMGPGNQPPPSG